MRLIPYDISTKLSRTMQTAANNANPSSDIWINRPHTPLVSDDFLERQSIFDSSVSDVSIAVCHPRFRADSTMVYLGYILDGKARLLSALTKTKMDEHLWLHENFEKDASAISVAFDGTMPKGVDGRVEVVTETLPWVFWVNEGVLYAQKLGEEGEPTVLAVANCTDVSAISASDSDTSGFDFGLIVFFNLAGNLYYRQYIDDVWYDGVFVTNAPTDIVGIAAFRTWDYRVGVQIKTTDGRAYELYTQYMGIGKRNVEHLSIPHIDASGKNTPITYHDTSTLGNIEMSVTAKSLYAWGFSSIPVAAENFADENDDYGHFVTLTFDHPIRDVSKHASQFYMFDSFGLTYGCEKATTSDDGMTVTFEFTNFNLSEGNDLTIHYEAGDNPAQCMAVPLEDFEFVFTPVGLKRPDIPIPEPTRAWVVDSDGTKLAIEFSQQLISTTVSKNSDAFKIYIDEYDMTPGGTLNKIPRVNTSISLDSTEKIIYITFERGNTTSLQNGENVIIEYSNGTVCGYGGPVVFFNLSFAPTNTVKKNNPNDLERINLTVSAEGKLKEITYRSVKSPDEHAIELVNISAVGVLTHIDDL